MMRALYDITVEKLTDNDTYDLAIGPSRRNGTQGVKPAVDRQAVLALLIEHAHYSKEDAARWMNKVDREGEAMLHEHELSSEDAMAFGWSQ